MERAASATCTLRCEEANKATTRLQLCTSSSSSVSSVSAIATYESGRTIPCASTTVSCGAASTSMTWSCHGGGLERQSGNTHQQSMSRNQLVPCVRQVWWLACWSLERGGGAQKHGWTHLLRMHLFWCVGHPRYIQLTGARQASSRFSITPLSVSLHHRGSGAAFTPRLGTRSRRERVARAVTRTVPDVSFIQQARNRLFWPFLCKFDLSHTCE